MRFRSLQDCRAVAALLVVLFHAAGTLAKEKYLGAALLPLDHFFWFGGDAGVAFFFVLSGFIIHHVHAKDIGMPQRCADYLFKRAIRIYPAYLILFAATAVGALSVPALRGSLPQDGGVWLKAICLLPQDMRLVGGTGAPVLVVAWSLQYELVFYGLMALAILNRRLGQLSVVIVAACVALNTWVPQDAFALRFLGNHLMLLFGLGVLTSMALHRGWCTAWPGARACLAAAAFILTAIAATGSRAQYDRLPFDLAYGLSSAALIHALAQRDRTLTAGSTFGGVLPAVVGDASYALYLLHFPLVSVLAKLASSAVGRSFFEGVLALIAVTLACVVVSVAFHRFVERPLMGWLQALRRPYRTTSLA